MLDPTVKVLVLISTEKREPFIEGMVHTHASRIQRGGIRKVARERGGVRTRNHRAVIRLRIGSQERQKGCASDRPGIVRGDFDQLDAGLSQSSPFVRSKEKRLGPRSRPPEIASKIVVTLCCPGLVGSVGKPVVGIEHVISEEFVDSAMKTVRARPGGKDHLATGGTPEFWGE